VEGREGGKREYIYVVTGNLIAEFA